MTPRSLVAVIIKVNVQIAIKVVIQVILRVVIIVVANVVSAAAIQVVAICWFPPPSPLPTQPSSSQSPNGNLIFNFKST